MRGNVKVSSQCTSKPAVDRVIEKQISHFAVEDAQEVLTDFTRENSARNPPVTPGRLETDTKNCMQTYANDNNTSTTLENEETFRDSSHHAPKNIIEKI